MGRYVELSPPSALRRFLDCLWICEVDGPPPPDGRRLLPTGQVDVVWIAGHGVRLAGPLSRFLRPPELSRVLVFGARLHAGAAPSLLRTPAAELADAHLALDAIVPRLAARLDDRMLHAADRPAAFAAELGRALRGAEDPDPQVLAAVRLLDAGEPVAGVAQRTFVSERALQRRFAEHVGYGPKTLQRVLRFQRFLRAAPRMPLARAASLAGYADQSHLTRETRRLAGLTPRQLAAGAY